jgi:DNA-binding beta-propeller fold protein YncE
MDLNENKIDNEIRVGTFPISVDVNDTTNTTYVLNRFSGTISIIK